MKPTRENIFRVLVQLEQSDSLPKDGPISVFVRRSGGMYAHTAQYAVKVSGDAVFVRTSRLPFAKTLAFSRHALRSASL